MTDREKTIKRLEECLSASCRGFRTCPYGNKDWDAVRAALELLREQETEYEDVGEVIMGDEIVEWWKCKNCGYHIYAKCRSNPGFRYCPHCGRAVKW